MRTFANFPMAAMKASNQKARGRPHNPLLWVSSPTAQLTAGGNPTFQSCTVRFRPHALLVAHALSIDDDDDPCVRIVQR